MFSTTLSSYNNNQKSEKIQNFIITHIEDNEDFNEEPEFTFEESDFPHTFSYVRFCADAYYDGNNTVLRETTTKIHSLSKSKVVSKTRKSRKIQKDIFQSGLYKTRLCFRKGKCNDNFGDDGLHCWFAHSIEQLRPLPGKKNLIPGQKVDPAQDWDCECRYKNFQRNLRCNQCFRPRPSRNDERKELDLTRR